MASLKILTCPNCLFSSSNHTFTALITLLPIKSFPSKLAGNVPLHENPYFPGPGISLKALKDQASVILTSTFWLKKDRIFHHRKVQNKNFSVTQSKNFLVTIKYHLSIIFLSQKKTVFPVLENFKNKNFLVISKYHLSINFFSQKRPYFPPAEKFKTRTFH